MKTRPWKFVHMACNASACVYMYKMFGEVKLGRTLKYVKYELSIKLFFIETTLLFKLEVEINQLSCYTNKRTGISKAGQKLRKSDICVFLRDVNRSIALQSQYRPPINTTKNLTLQSHSTGQRDCSTYMCVKCV